MSEAAMLASLRDIHLPATAPGGSLADICVVIGFAALAALLAAFVLRMLSVRRPARLSPPAAARLAALDGLSAADRRVALLHLLRAQAPARYAALKGQLYQPAAGPDDATLEAEVARLA